MVKVSVSVLLSRIIFLSLILDAWLEEAKFHTEEESVSNGYYLDGLNEIAPAAGYVTAIYR